MKKLDYILVALLLTSFLSIHAATIANDQVLEQLYFEICQDVTGSISFSDSTCVIDQPSQKTDYNWLIEKQFFNCLTQAGFKNIYSGAQLSDATHISYESVQQRIYYHNIPDKKVERHVDVQLHVRCVDSKKIILKDEIITRTFTDTITAKEIKTVENIKFPFTKGEQKRSFLKKMYEPVLLTLLTGWIIYLFYSYRSQ